MDISQDETKDKIMKKRRNHLLKRIKKHLGIVRRDSKACSSHNNLPPLKFHNVHGDNIRISRDGTLAKRFESFCRAITFSARPICINERIYIRFSEISNNWNGGVRFGFTSNDPASLKHSLPKYACPDLTNRPGFWAKALHEQYCELDNVLHYYVNSVGDVIYGINGEEKGIILSGIDVRGLLWSIIDVYGNVIAIDLLDARSYDQPFSAAQISNSNHSINSIVTPLQSLNILDNEANMPQLEYHTYNLQTPMIFHATKGRNIQLSSDHLTATRTDNDFCQGYVFTSRPIQTEEKIFIQILKTDNTYVGALALGLTSCNPASLNQYDLPDDSNFLLDRPEYWVVKKDIALPCNKGDNIIIYVSSKGEVMISQKNKAPLVLMHVDHRLRLWMFFDVYGSTQSICFFRKKIQNVHTPNAAVATNQTTKSSNSLNSFVSYSSSSLNNPFSSSNLTALTNINEVSQLPIQHCSREVSFGSGSVIGNVSLPKPGQIYMPSTNDMIKVQSGGTILLVNIPPTTSRANEFDCTSEGAKEFHETVSSYSSIPNMPTYTNNTIKPNPSLGNKTRTCNSVSKQNLEEKENYKESIISECTICYEKNIDSVLYMCGHMCMCYKCAIEQWRGTGGGQCPLCRAVIRDVIRTYTT